MNEPAGYLLYALWFFLPAGVANATPVLANKVPVLNRWKAPIDFGRSYRGKRILGDNKTWRGLVFGSLIGGLTGLLIYLTYPAAADRLWHVPLDPALNMTLLGTLLGFGALVGDALESFFKRRTNVPPGHTWFPFDQTDYIIGGALASSLLTSLSTTQYIWIGCTWFVMHLLASYIGYLLHLKDKPI